MVSPKLDNVHETKPAKPATGKNVQSLCSYMLSIRQISIKIVFCHCPFRSLWHWLNSLLVVCHFYSFVLSFNTLERHKVSNSDDRGDQTKEELSSSISAMNSSITKIIKIMRRQSFGEAVALEDAFSCRWGWADGRVLGDGLRNYGRWVDAVIGKPLSGCVSCCDTTDLGRALHKKYHSPH